MMKMLDGFFQRPVMFGLMSFVLIMVILMVVGDVSPQDFYQMIVAFGQNADKALGL